MKGKDIIIKILNENGTDKDYNFSESRSKRVKAKAPVKEPESLSEIADVRFEYNRLVLDVSDPKAARKFALDDAITRYEYDGYTMYVYRDIDEPAFWSFSCGHGASTLVSSSVERYRDAVKEEMLKQVYKKKIKCPKDLVYQLLFVTRGYKLSDFTWCE